jgi:hypothetical protein
MKVRAVDPSLNDWTFGKGLNNYLTGELALYQSVKTRLLSWKDDCFFSLQDGVDYRSLLDKGQGNNLIQALKICILSTEGVSKINTIEGTLGSDRVLSVAANIDTIYGKNYQIAVTI